MNYKVSRIICLATFAAGVSFTAFGGTTINVGSGETYTTITEAMTYVGTLGDDAFPVEIVVKPGTYAETGFTLNKAITIRGATGNPADVEIVDNAAGSRAFTLSDANAAVRDLTVSGTGYHTSSGYGGHVNMTAGTVENCILTDGCAGTKVSSGSTAASNGRGGNVWMSGGRLVRCQVLNGKANDYKGSGTASYGAGIYASGGVVESCLVRGNLAWVDLGVDSPANVFGGGLYADGPVTVANCTFADNVAGVPATSAGGIQLGKDTAKAAKIVNCIFYGNGGTTVTEFGGVNLGRFSHCASTVMNDGGGDCRIIGEQDFVSAAMGNFHLMCDSELVDGGTRDPVWYPESASTLDLDGLPRFSGNEVDVGCFEVDQRALVFSGRAEAYAVFEGSNLNFIASHRGPSATVTYKWDFGDDRTLETQESVAVHAYAASGLYTVSVCASTDGGSSWSDPFVLATKVVVAPDVIFVDSASASPLFPYKTRDTAAKTFRDALAALTNNISGGYATVPGATIRVCSGTHTDTGVVLRSGVRIVGDTGNPAGVEIVDSVVGSRAFTLEHPDAVVRDLTVSGAGWHQTGGEGGHLRMAAGTVENCILKDGNAGARDMKQSNQSKGSGGNVWMSGGRLVRCQVLDGKANDYGGGASGCVSYGAGIYAEGGVVESCLVRGNLANFGSASQVFGGGLYANGPVTVANCTFVDNVAGVPATSAGGIQLGKDTAKAAKIVNCIFYGNGGTTVTEFANTSIPCFSHCASSITNATCDTWQVVSADDFTDDYHLKTALLVDAGTQEEGWYPEDASTLDLDGLARVSGREIDVGCYEVDHSGLSCSGSPSVYGAFEGSNVTFTAQGVGGSGNYVFEWDFGDETSSGPAGAVCTHAYQTSGLFTMRVRVSDDSGATWSDWSIVPTKIVVTPKEMFVNASAANSKFPYRTPETGALTLGEALAALTNDTSEGCAYTDGAIVRVCPGTYSETGFQLKHGISVIGQTGNPADVEIVDNVEGCRAFTIEHADALVSGLTVSGRGWHWTGGEGGHVRMTAGTVENCVLTGGCAGAHHSEHSAQVSGRGGNVWMSGGRLVRCQILNGKANEYNGVNVASLGSGIYAEGGVVENCLVRGNLACDENDPKNVLGAGLYANGSVSVVNCTFIDNVPGVPDASAGGIQLGSAEAKVVTCVFFNNGGTATREFGGDHLDRFDHCASSVNNDQCDTWQVIDATAFRNWEKRDEKLNALTPKTGKPLVDTGTSEADYRAAGATSPVDLLGMKRLFGRHIDIGCFESQVGGLMLMFK